MAGKTPIIVGVGQYSERIDSEGYRALSPVELAAEAARHACADSGIGDVITRQIDTVAATRQFENSMPMAVAPFGRSNNFPRSVSQRLGITPAHAILEVAGGQSPQKLVGEFCEKIAEGKIGMGLMFGAEAISTVRSLMGREDKPNWSETIEGELEERGYGLEGLMSHVLQQHNLLGAPPGYGLLENARRGRLGLTREQYAHEMGTLFERFTKVAAQHPHSASPHEQSAEDLITANERNRMIAEPYTRMLVARDQVNQAAAILLTSVETARELGIPESKWVYLHGYADLKERDILDRQDLGASPASALACKTALDLAGITADDLTFIDLYSCFPVPVFMARDALGIAANDKRDLTVTGGLPFFGGAGNNYSMHGIATIVEKLREKPGTYGFIGANGGYASKYSTGIYSTRPKAWKKSDSEPLQKKINALSTPEYTPSPEGWATIETYTILYDKGRATTGSVIGRLEESGRRFVANTADGDAESLQAMLSEDPLNRRIYVRSFGFGNRFAFS